MSPTKKQCADSLVCHSALPTCDKRILNRNTLIGHLEDGISCYNDYDVIVFVHVAQC